MTKNLPKRLTSTFVYIILRLVVFIVLILNIFHKNYENVFICLLTLVLFMMPSFIEKKFKIDIPETLEIIIFSFIFSAEILGEINSFYTLFPNWDTILHTINGFIMGAIGFSLIELLNESKNISMKLSPLFVALVSFCFSMTIGVFWEFFEFGADKFLGLDMQKDTVIQEIHSVTFDENHLNNVHKVVPDTIVINGEDWIQKYGGYIDVGLIDTMKDLLVNFVGALTFSFIGYFYSRSRDRNKMSKILITSRKEYI